MIGERLRGENVRRFESAASQTVHTFRLDALAIRYQLVLKNFIVAMQSLQTMAKAPTQPANLPPLQNLPSWSRNTLGRRKQPRPIIRDRLQPIKSIREEMDEGLADEKSNENSNFSGRIVSAPSRGHLLDHSRRIDNVEKRIDYLRTQHAETLSNLHSEIERLKAENKGECYCRSTGSRNLDQSQKSGKYMYDNLLSKY